MKCPDCGREYFGLRLCEYCGAELVKTDKDEERTEPESGFDGAEEDENGRPDVKAILEKIDHRYLKAFQIFSQMKGKSAVLIEEELSAYFKAVGIEPKEGIAVMAGYIREITTAKKGIESKTPDSKTDDTAPGCCQLSAGCLIPSLSILGLFFVSFFFHDWRLKPYYVIIGCLFMAGGASGHFGVRLISSVFPRLGSILLTSFGFFLVIYGFGLI